MEIGSFNNMCKNTILWLKLHKLGQIGSYLPRYLHVFVFVNDPISTCSENELHTLNGCLGE